MYSYIAKSVFNDLLRSSNYPCYIQNSVIANHVIKKVEVYVELFNGHMILLLWSFQKKFITVAGD